MPASPPPLHDVLSALTDVYGELRATITDPFEMVLLENVAYLVDDATREQTLERLRTKIGLTPARILARASAEVAEAIAGGGMKPAMRAAKVIAAAEIAEEIGEMLAGDLTQAKKLLRRFPSIGEPYADRILLFAGRHVNVAPDSNALRVLCRLGFAREEKNYARMYRAAVAATAPQLRSPEEAQRAHLLLRRHGQELCTRSHPRCDACPLRPHCAWYAKLTSEDA